ncbi:hypothetical protein [Motiliproteus sp. MSK22-1]|uniref:hypothetical protein n=1 Tax=Motiliproteus sp. MSK22-1 TaxID=1897630 RepID=UPI000978294F|nr:hypothetical protein [Motiliproteus sp. MSK22-1]OMH38827.1 hypothetical protein BGP75_00150 [Motiliproteus sp. MSK22-1]
MNDITYKNFTLRVLTDGLKLLIIDDSNKVLHEIEPPDNSGFYFPVVTEIDGPCVIVCFDQDHKINERTDWRFTVDITTGRIERKCPWV